MPSPKKISTKYLAPYLDKGRSKFDLSHTSHFDFYNGLLTPVDTPILVIPGDTFDLSQRTFIRMSQPLKVAPFDTIQADVHYFFVPMRLLYDGWNEFMTGDNGTDWSQLPVDILPEIAIDLQADEDVSNTAYAGVHGLIDYIGIPPHSKQYDASDTTSVSIAINSLPLKGYYCIWNWFYRFEPLFNQVYIDTSLTQDTLDTSETFISGIISNKLCPVMKLPDYFSRALPQPTRGPEVTLDLALPESLWPTSVNIKNSLEFLVTNNGSLDTTTSTYTGIPGSWKGDGTVNSHTSRPFYQTGPFFDDDDGESFWIAPGFANLFGGSINNLREAFVIDKIRRIDALYGSRIGSYTQGHYGVTPPELNNQPEYLGGHTFDINVNQVVQTSDKGSGSGELGDIGGYSFTKHEGHYFTKSFTEFGYIFGLINTRVKHHTYAQGLSSIFKKIHRLDYWLPEMSNMSDQPQYKYELFITADNFRAPFSVFGYQERGWEYKNLECRVAGLMRPQVNGTLDVWTYTDNYESAPYLSADWIIEPINAIDRSLELSSDDVPPFIAHLFFDVKAYRVMPYHSIPGGLTGSW